MRVYVQLKNDNKYSKSLVSMMWPSVYSWTGHCAPTGHQWLCQTLLSAQGSHCQHID